MVELPRMCGSQTFVLSPCYRVWYDNATGLYDENEVPTEVLETGIEEVVDENDGACAGISVVEPSASLDQTDPVVSIGVEHATISSNPTTKNAVPAPTDSGLVDDPADPEVLVDTLKDLAHELDELNPDVVFTAQAGPASGWDNLDDYWKMLPDGIKETHVPGRVETATRVVHSIKHSDPDAGIGSSGELNEEERVEEELRTKFGRVVMRPWAAYIDGRRYGADIPRPVVDDLVDSAVKLGTHNPLKDDIEVVLRDEEVKGLMLGWGLQGTFVQLVRRSFTEGDEKAVAGEDMSKKTLWFMVECREILPTYYTAMED